MSRGLITADQLRIALHEQKHSGDILGRHLVRLGFLSEQSLRSVLAASLDLPEADLTHFTPDPAAITCVPEQLARRHRMLPLHFEHDKTALVLAVADPEDVVALDGLRSILPARTRLEVKLGCESEIMHALDHAYSFELSIDGILKELENDEQVRTGSPSSSNTEHPVVRLLDAILTDAARRNASDIHFEPEAGFLRLRYRIDGLLQQFRVLHKSLWSALSVRIKILADLNIAETRAPQDGRFSLTIHGRELDFRVSAQPTIHGECLVLRLLDRTKGVQPLETLGLATRRLSLLERALLRPEGIFLVTGPTGSGKTTTLYSILKQLSSETLNIMTLEDPVEYPMELVRQTSISDACKMDFANGIRSMMRQDPDVILIGEIRDAPTAEMAFRAAMTGHQVFATLHCNSALGAIPRLMDVGIDASILAGNIIAIMAQRLVRKLCPNCRLLRQANPEERRILGEHIPGDQVFAACGCPVCGFTGYKGRLALTEIVKMDADLDELVSRKAGRKKLAEAARGKGFQTLAEDGLSRVAEGLTTLSELRRVIDLSDRLLTEAG
ncbi:GspE/PulE family protein [Uliginosibacterium paludis]|uniref:GspE/PulE family protein n=1 Tax=Uliginosibacterium paludis TaxID=1615952 RepID=A0ABV2CUQ5_9RHOO